MCHKETYDQIEDLADTFLFVGCYCVAFCSYLQGSSIPEYMERVGVGYRVPRFLASYIAAVVVRNDAALHGHSGFADWVRRKEVRSSFHCCLRNLVYAAVEGLGLSACRLFLLAWGLGRDESRSCEVVL